MKELFFERHSGGAFSLGILMLAGLFWTGTLKAQDVSTLFSNLSSGNLTFDDAGNIYASDFLGSCATFNTCSNGRVIRRLLTTGRVDTFMTWTNPPGPTGSVWDRNGNFYVSLYSSNSVVKRFSDGSVVTLATGIHGPTGMVLDDSGDLLIAEGGYTSPGGPGQNIRRVTQNGQVSTYATSTDFNGANGLVRDSTGNLYVANWFTGVIHKVTPSGVVSRIAVLPGGASGWMTIIPGGLLVCARNAHQIVKVSFSGNISVFAGTGSVGFLDGPASQAVFSLPNGILATASGDTVYVAETEARRIRIITNGMVSSVDLGTKEIYGFDLEPNYPNPFNPTTSIRYQIQQKGKVNLAIYNLGGELVETLVNSEQNAGAYSVEWNASRLSSGVYFIKMTAHGSTLVRKSTLLK